MYKNRLRILMAEKCIKITELSKETGISRTTLTSLYYERTKAIKFETLNILCNFFGCTPNDLITIENDKKQQAR